MTRCPASADQFTFNRRLLTCRHKRNAFVGCLIAVKTFSARGCFFKWAHVPSWGYKLHNKGVLIKLKRTLEWCRAWFCHFTNSCLFIRTWSIFFSFDARVVRTVIKFIWRVCKCGRGNGSVYVYFQLNGVIFCMNYVSEMFFVLFGNRAESVN